MPTTFLHSRILLAITVFFLWLMPESVLAQSIPKLRYGFKADQEYWYDVKIRAGALTQSATFKGTLVFKVVAATNDEFAIISEGQLYPTLIEIPAVPQPGVIPRRSQMQFRPPSPENITYEYRQRPEGTSFNRWGVVVMSREIASLPFWLGKQVELVVEILPDSDKNYWERSRDITMIERDPMGPRVGPMVPGNIVTTKRTAKEQIDYSIIEQKDDTIRIDKKYSLKTEAEEGIVHLDMSGKGDFVFDLKMGLIRSQSMDYELRINEDNRKRIIPISLTYNLKSDAEMAAIKERQKKAHLEAEARAEVDKIKPFEPGERDKMIEYLKSGDFGRIQAAALRLQKVQPTEDRDDLCRALCEGFKTPNLQTKYEVLNSLKLWLTPEAEPTIIEAATTDNALLQSNAIVLLGNFKTENAAKAAAKQLAHSRQEAVATLKTIGPIAEPHVIPLLKEHSPIVRRSVAEILGEIGSQDCLPHLQEGLSRASIEDKRIYEDAIAAVKKRPPSEKSGHSGKADGTTDQARKERKTRTWHDIRGTPQFEATFIKADAFNVTLEKADGKVITLSIKRLSKADQEYIEQKRNNPESPFEQ